MKAVCVLKYSIHVPVYSANLAKVVILLLICCSRFYQWNKMKIPLTVCDLL